MAARSVDAFKLTIISWTWSVMVKLEKTVSNCFRLVLELKCTELHCKLLQEDCSYAFTTSRLLLGFKWIYNFIKCLLVSGETCDAHRPK